MILKLLLGSYYGVAYILDIKTGELLNILGKNNKVNSYWLNEVSILIRE